MDTILDSEVRLSLYVPLTKHSKKQHQRYSFTPSCAFLSVNTITQYIISCKTRENLTICLKYTVFVYFFSEII